MLRLHIFLYDYLRGTSRLIPSGRGFSNKPNKLLVTVNLIHESFVLANNLSLLAG